MPSKQTYLWSLIRKTGISRIVGMYGPSLMDFVKALDETTLDDLLDALTAYKRGDESKHAYIVEKIKNLNK